MSYYILSMDYLWVQSRICILNQYINRLLVIAWQCWVCNRRFWLQRLLYSVSYLLLLWSGLSLLIFRHIEICVFFALSMICVSIYRDNKLANLDSKQLVMKNQCFQIRGLLFFILSLFNNWNYKRNWHSILLLSALFIPEAFIPNGGVFAIDPDGDSDSGGKGVRALFGWLYATLCYGSSISFYYEVI